MRTHQELADMQLEMRLRNPQRRYLKRHIRTGVVKPGAQYMTPAHAARCNQGLLRAAGEKSEWRWVMDSKAADQETTEQVELLLNLAARTTRISPVELGRECMSQPRNFQPLHSFGMGE